MVERFPYLDRARDARAAQAALHAAFAKVRRRNDPHDPNTRRWHEAVEAYRHALDRAYPDQLWQAFSELRQGSKARIGLLIDFLEQDPFMFRSGYVKAEAIQAINRTPLTTKERQRLQAVVLLAVWSRDRREFRRYCRLARHVDAPEFRTQLEAAAANIDAGVQRRARWVLEALDQADRERASCKHLHRPNASSS